jgi:hypothetical protein
MNTGEHEEGQSTCLKRKKGNSTQALIENESDNAMFRTPAICRATNGKLLSNKGGRSILEEHLNESSEEEPHANQEPSRENDVIIDLSSRDEVVEAIKYLKDNKAAGSDSIALKSGRPSLVNTLNEMIQQVWIGESYCVQCTRRAINLTARIIAASAYLM